MISKVLLLLTALAAISAYPSNTIVDFETDLMDIEQQGVPGRAVEGEYSWVAPNGQEVSIKYIADKGGFRVLDEENTLPDGNNFEGYARSISSPAEETVEEKSAGVEEVVAPVEVVEAVEAAPEGEEGGEEGGEGGEEEGGEGGEEEGGEEEGGEGEGSERAEEEEGAEGGEEEGGEEEGAEGGE